MVAKPGTKRSIVLSVFKYGPATLSDVMIETGLEKKICAATINQLHRAGKLRLTGRVPSDRGGSGVNLYAVVEVVNGFKEKIVERLGYHKWPEHRSKLSTAVGQRCTKCGVIRKEQYSAPKIHGVVYSSDGGMTWRKQRYECVPSK